jgi:SAM-dependent methyltransferase
MSVFGNYSEYYDLLYQEKNYEAEVKYVHDFIRKFKPDTKKILDLGCGTGQHDFLLIEMGYSVTGVDCSEKMLCKATDRITEIDESTKEHIKFIKGDIRDVRLNHKFDTIISLFHVMSYQPNNSDLKQSFQTAYHHLVPGGLFIFDCWYGPGVLADPPMLRIKRIENENFSIIRIAEPTLYNHENIVDVNYHMIVKNKEKHSFEEIRECHRMRFLFKPEVELFFEQCGFKTLAFTEFLKQTPPDEKSWNVCFVARKELDEASGGQNIIE